MDHLQRQRFMIAASAIGPPGLFRRQGGSIREFLDDFVDDADTAKDVAVKVFEYFCLDDDAFNGFLPGVQLAVGFLDAVANGPSDDQQRMQSLKDLKKVLTTGNVNAIRQWVDANYQ